MERYLLRHGNVHSADDWRSVLEPIITRYRGYDIPRFFRGDAAFADPDVRMTSNVTKTPTTEEKSPVEVRGKDAEILDFRPIGVVRALSARRIGHIDNLTPRNRGPDFVIVDCVACRSGNHDVKWQIPA